MRIPTQSFRELLGFSRAGGTLPKAGFSRADGGVPGGDFKPALTNSDNVESEVKPSDLKNPPQPQADSEQEQVRLVMSRFRQSAEARRQHEREWLIAKSFEIGNQWVEWRTDTGRLESLIDPHDRYRSYIVVNKIRPITTKLKARATMSKPDASVAPLTDAPEDIGAAEEARCILDHYDLIFDRQHQTRSWVDSALTTSTSFLKILWDPTKEAWVPAMNPGAQMPGAPVQWGKARTKVGDIEEVIVPPFEVYPDAKAKSWRECGWLIHAKIVPLSYIQQKFGKAGYRIHGDTGSENEFVEARLDGIIGDQQRAGTPASKNSATLYEMWEKPTARYPKGRMIRVAGGQLLASGDWPYQKRDTFPFVPLGFQEKTGALWALNAVTDLIPLQRAFNNTLSRIQDRVNTDKPTILAREGSEIGLGAYQSKRNYEIVEFAGEPPAYQQAPPVNSYWFTYLQLLGGQMEDLSGVHEVSNGSVPPGVTAGNAIELLQQSDQTQMSEFVGNIESAQVERANWEIALCAQYYAEPRIIGLQEDDGTQGSAPAMQAAGILPGAGAPPAMPSPGAPAAGALGAPAGMVPPGVPGSAGLPMLPPSGPNAPGMAPPGVARGGSAGPPPGMPGTAAGGMTNLGTNAPALAAILGAIGQHAGGGPGIPVPAGAGVAAPQRPRQVMLRYLSRGGECRVKVTPGSATPKTAAAKSQQIIDLFHAGAFQPQNLPSLRLVTDLLNLERSDELNKQIDKEIDRQQQIAQANTPDPAAIEQIRQQGAAAQQEQQLRYQTQIKDLELSHREAMAHVQAQIDVEKERQLAMIPVRPTFSLKGDMTPPAVASAEAQNDLDTSLPAAQAAAYAQNAPKSTPEKPVTPKGNNT